jgi:hypothetical protein
MKISSASWKYIKWTVFFTFVGLIIVSERKATNWQTVYDEMSPLEKSTIEMGLGIPYFDGTGYCVLVGGEKVQLDPRPLLHKMKAAGFSWDGKSFRDQTGRKYSRPEVFQQLFPETTSISQKAIL